LWRTVVGLALAVVVGTLIGMVMGFSRFAREGLYPILVGFNAIPKATVVPIVALMFVGQHDFNTVLIAFMISFFPIAVSVSIGLSTLEPEYRDILRSLGASNFTIFWKIALPKTLPEFFGALKVAVTLAFIGTNLMEIVSPHGKGLGDLFDSGRISADYPLMFAVLFALAALGILLVLRGGVPRAHLRGMGGTRAGVRGAVFQVKNCRENTRFPPPRPAVSATGP
jgi:NitT/TauT family transport system permease protein